MKTVTVICFLALFLLGLSSLRPAPENRRLPARAKMTLSEYGFFQGDMAEQQPIAGVLPYDLNTPLFSDYAQKLRFVQLPEGQAATYRERDVLDLPVGSVLIKTFYYPQDFRQPEQGRVLLETRLLLHEEDGWYALPYIWNEEQTEAQLEVAGGTKDIAWKDLAGQPQQLAYSIPNMNQCKGCHVKNQQIKPIGPTARQLNRNHPYADGEQNQLVKWESLGYLNSRPPDDELPRLAVWDDPASGTLNERARAYLDINCAHCHSAEAPANTSGLLLDYYQTDSTALGIAKPPVAAGRGTGGNAHDIVPGHPKASIMWYRITSTDPGVRMPELGRQLVHEEGVALIEEWIESLTAE
ncbi:MAG: SO2930 family diheme c-type cytochrome [Cyclobacteriaceae bacterium]